MAQNLEDKIIGLYSLGTSLRDISAHIKIRMEERGFTNKDLPGKIRSKGYVSALLNKRKPLTLELARLFHQELNIPAVV